MKSDFFPQPGECLVREELSEWPRARVLRFERTGDLIHVEALPEFVTVVREFFREP